VGAKARSDEELKHIFKEEDRYRILIVASKFQTGFDEPYLHTLFLDKPVKGVNAVQTLSRLNRCIEGKTDTLVVDFTNSFAEIAKAFQYFLGQAEEIQEVRFTLEDLQNAFTALCTVTKTTAEDWTPRDGDKPPTEAQIDKACHSLKDKCDGKSEVKRVLDILGYFLAKTLLCDNIEWSIRKSVLQGVLGYLSDSTGKYSGKELKEAVTAIGLATELLAIGHQSVDTGSGKKTGKSTPPREVSLAEAICKINQDNQRKLFEQITAIKEKEREFWERMPPEAKTILLTFQEAGAKEICAQFHRSENITEIVEEKAPVAWEDCWDSLYPHLPDKRGETLLEFCQILQRKAKLSELEIRFYQTQRETHQELENTVVKMESIRSEIEKMEGGIPPSPS
jgi:hypothetical protein